MLIEGTFEERYKLIPVVLPTMLMFPPIDTLPAIPAPPATWREPLLVFPNVLLITPGIDTLVGPYGAVFVPNAI